MGRFEDFLSAHKLNELLKRQDKIVEIEEAKKPANKVLWCLAIVGAIVAIAGIAYAVYRFFTPDYLEDFEDDFDDDFDDDFFDDDDEIEKKVEDAKEKVEAV